MEGIWAAGDLRESYHLVTVNRSTCSRHVPVTGESSITLEADINPFPGVVGTASDKICAVEVARTGLS